MPQGHEHHRRKHHAGVAESGNPVSMASAVSMDFATGGDALTMDNVLESTAEMPFICRLSDLVNVDEGEIVLVSQDVFMDFEGGDQNLGLDVQLEAAGAMQVIDGAPILELLRNLTAHSAMSFGNPSANLTADMAIAATEEVEFIGTVEGNPVELAATADIEFVGEVGPNYWDLGAAAVMRFQHSTSLITMDMSLVGTAQMEFLEDAAAYVDIWNPFTGDDAPSPQKARLLIGEGNTHSPPYILVANPPDPADVFNVNVEIKDAYGWNPYQLTPAYYGANDDANYVSTYLTNAPYSAYQGKDILPILAVRVPQTGGAIAKRFRLGKFNKATLWWVPRGVRIWGSTLETPTSEFMWEKLYENGALDWDWNEVKEITITNDKPYKWYAVSFYNGGSMIISYIGDTRTKMGFKVFEAQGIIEQNLTLEMALGTDAADEGSMEFDHEVGFEIVKLGNQDAMSIQVAAGPPVAGNVWAWPDTYNNNDLLPASWFKKASEFEFSKNTSAGWREDMIHVITTPKFWVARHNPKMYDGGVWGHRAIISKYPVIGSYGYVPEEVGNAQVFGNPTAPAEYHVEPIITRDNALFHQFTEDIAVGYVSNNNYPYFFQAAYGVATGKPQITFAWGNCPQPTASMMRPRYQYLRSLFVAKDTVGGIYCVPVPATEYQFYTSTTWPAELYKISGSTWLTLPPMSGPVSHMRGNNRANGKFAYIDPSAEAFTYAGFAYLVGGRKSPGRLRITDSAGASYYDSGSGTRFIECKVSGDMAIALKEDGTVTFPLGGDAAVTAAIPDFVIDEGAIDVALSTYSSQAIAAAITTTGRLVVWGSTLGTGVPSVFYLPDGQIGSHVNGTHPTSTSGAQNPKSGTYYHFWNWAWTSAQRIDIEHDYAIASMGDEA